MLGLDLSLGKDESKMKDVDLMLELAKSNDTLLLANRRLKAEIAKKDAAIEEILNESPVQEIEDLKEEIFSLDCQMKRLVDENEALRSEALADSPGMVMARRVAPGIRLKELMDRLERVIGKYEDDDE